MITILKKGANSDAIDEINKKLNKRRSKKGLNAKKFCGVVKFEEDGLIFQKRLRNEWE